MLSVRMSSYGYTQDVWRARKIRKSCSRCSREQSQLLECSRSFPSASITRYTHAKHEQILKSNVTRKKQKEWSQRPGRNHCYSACVNRNGPRNEKFWRWKCQSNWTDPSQRGFPPEWETKLSSPCSETFQTWFESNPYIRFSINVTWLTT